MYLQLELLFEKLTSVATRILGNSISFMVALVMVLYWWATSLFTEGDSHRNIGDIIFGTTFLSLFIIQKSFNRYSALLHLKINELISSHESANNAVMNTDEKTEREINELSHEYTSVQAIETKIEAIIVKENNDSTANLDLK